jgi:hypothetical protein
MSFHHITGGFMIKLENEKVRAEKHYTIGYDKKNDRYILSVIVPWVAWFNRYYLISKQEYDFYETDLEKLDLLAEECYKAKTSSKRFVYSEKVEENNGVRPHIT